MAKTKKKSLKPGFIHDMQMQFREHKITFFVYMTLRAMVIACLVLSAIHGAYENVFVCVLVLFLFLAPAFIEKKLKIDLPTTLEVIILLFIFSAEILGEIFNYYGKFANWDNMLHTINGFLFAAVGFSLLDIINRNERFKFQLSPFYLAVTAFCFSMTIGVLWEFFEFGCDLFLKTDMQKDFIIHDISSTLLNPAKANIPYRIHNITDVTVNGVPLGVNGYVDIGLIDTMKDLFVNFIGAVVFSIIGFFYVKNRGKGKFASSFIPRIANDDTYQKETKEE